MCLTGIYQSDIPESDRYGLIGLVLGLKNKDLSLATENLLKVQYGNHDINIALLRHFSLYALPCSLDFLRIQHKWIS